MAITIKQANVWQRDSASGLDQLGASSITSISVVSDDNPAIGSLIAAELADNEIPVAFATVRPGVRKYEAVYGFNSQADADAAFLLISEIGSRPARLQIVRGRGGKTRRTGGGIKPKKNNPPRKMKRTA